MRCGDGVVSGNEQCDSAIPRGEPGACPTECPPLSDCVSRLLNGTSCQAKCVLSELLCTSGDGCCPGKCTKDNDADCNGRCGDGIVQASAGETCEPNTDTPCPTSCDDNKGCTVDRLTGSQAKCNVRCTHDAIQSVGTDDGCCPDGANAKTDPNCDPKCGNGVMEKGEDCDGSDDCDSNCILTDSAKRTQCMSEERDDCERCACEECTATEVACRFGTNANDKQLCANAVACSKRNICIGSACYCGDSPGCAVPIGPCRAEYEAAGGNPLQIASAISDPSTLVGRAYAADQCRVAKCEMQCR
jgi:hypothetical protein